MAEINQENTRTPEEGALAGGMAGQVVSSDLLVWRRGIEDVLGNGYSPTALITELKKHPRLAFLYEQDSRIPERYTIEEHTEMVLAQFERYLAGVPMPSGMSRSELRLVLALHDIGKSIPPNKEDQHRATIEVIESLRVNLPLTESGWAIGKFLIDNDLIGETIRAGIAQLAALSERKAIGERARREPIPLADLEAFANLVAFKPFPGDRQSGDGWRMRFESGAQLIGGGAARLGLAPMDLMNLMVLFYQADTAAYSYDAVTAGGRRASPGLDFLYAFNPDFELGRVNDLLVVESGSGLLKFSAGVEQIVQGLAGAVSRHPHFSQRQ